MITKELVAYIRRELSRGIPRDTLSRVLVTNGWNQKDVEEAFDFLKTSSQTPTLEIKPEVSKPEIKVEQKIEFKQEEIKKPEIREQKVDVKKQIEIRPQELEKPHEKVEVKPAEKPVQKIEIIPKEQIKSTQGFSEKDLTENPMLIPNSVKEYAWKLSNDRTSTIPELNTKPNSIENKKVPESVKVEKKEDKPSMYSAQDSTFLKGKRRVMKILVFVIIIILLGVGAVYGYQKYFVNNPNRILNSSSGGAEIQSLKFKAQIQIEGASKTPFTDAVGLGDGQEKFQISVDGAFDTKDKEKPKASISASVGASVLFDTPEIFETRYVENIFYFKVPKTSLLDLFIPKEAQPTSDSWVSFSENDKDIVTSEMPDLAKTVAFAKEIPTRFFSGGLSNLKSAIVSNGAIRDFSFEKKEIVDGNEAYKINFSVDNNGLAKAIDSLTKNTNSSDEIENIKTKIKSLTFTDGSLWVGTSDYLLYRFAITAYKADSQTNEKTITQILLSFSNFNDSIQIDPPSPSLSASELFNSVEKTKGQVTTRELLSAAKLTADVYSKSHSNLKGICTNQQGFADLINDIIHATTGLPKPTCRSDTTSWIIFAPYGNTELYWCVDSTGSNKEVISKPQSLICK